MPTLGLSEVFNRQYEYEGTALASAARTASVNSATFETPWGVRGVRVYINATASAATPSVVFTIADLDPVSGTSNAILASAAITGAGLTVLTVYPGMTVAANLVASVALPKRWRVQAVAGDSDSLTYSVGFSYLY